MRQSQPPKRLWRRAETVGLSPGCRRSDEHAAVPAAGVDAEVVFRSSLPGWRRRRS